MLGRRRLIGPGRESLELRRPELLRVRASERQALEVDDERTEDRDAAVALGPGEQLFDLLAREFAAHDFDIKWLFREIALSQAYQRSSLLPEGLEKVAPEERSDRRWRYQRVPVEIVPTILMPRQQGAMMCRLVHEHGAKSRDGNVAIDMLANLAFFQETCDLATGFFKQR